MKKSLPLAILGLIVSGCSTPTPNSFRTGDIDYTSVKHHAPIAETRVFVKESAVCKSLGSTSESLPPLAISAASYLVKEGIAYGKDYLEKQAAYLSSDIILNSNAYLTFEKSNTWPNKATLQQAQTDRDGYINEAEAKTKKQYKAEHPNKTKTEKSLAAEIEKSKSLAAIEYDNKTKIQGGANDLCILIVSGEYQSENENTRKNNFLKFAKSPSAPVDEYRMTVPGLTFNESKKPFENLSSDPSFVAELHVIPTVTRDKIIYTIKPNYIFYPKPLHKGTANGLERKVMIELGFGPQKPTLSFDTLKSGWTYDTEDLVTKYAIFESPLNQDYQSISIKISEGPDKMPTAKILTELSTHDKDLEKYLIEKIETLEKKSATEKTSN